MQRGKETQLRKSLEEKQKKKELESHWIDSTSTDMYYFISSNFKLKKKAML